MPAVGASQRANNAGELPWAPPTGSSISSYGQSPCSVTKRKKFKWFSGESNSNPMDTSSTTSSSVELIQYSSQPFDDFKKPHDYFSPISVSSDQGDDT